MRPIITCLSLMCTLFLASSVAAQGAGKIVFEHIEDTDVEIFIMNPDGTDLVNLSNHPGRDQRPEALRDGSKIVFESRRGELGEAVFEIFVMDADGSNQINLTNTPSHNDHYPSWSPEGSKISFHSDRHGLPGIYAMDPDGSNQVLLTGDNYAIGAAWSPDGSRISFLSVDRSDFLKSYIWTMNADGSNPVQLTDEPRNSYPTWSPDGTKIVFTRVANGFKAIWIMDADGGNEVKLMNNRDVGGRLSWVSSEQRTTLIEALSWGRLKANFR